LLAALVLISHTGIRWFDYNPGVVAVISFYLLSGFVMRSLIERNYMRLVDVPKFYLDRAARLFPQFLFYMAVTFTVVYVCDIRWIAERFTSWQWFLNATMLPLGFDMFWDRQPPAIAMMQAWSLGLELCFYLVIPFILIYLKPKARYWLAWLSFGVFALAHVDMIPDYWAYRLLPGTLFIFLVGVSFHDDDRGARWFRWSIFAVITAMWLHAFSMDVFYNLYANKEIMVGILLGIVFVSLLHRLKWSHVDEFMGNLSYGVFLNHFIVIWWMQKYRGISTFDTSDVTLLITVSTGMAYISYLIIERPALRLRQRLRKPKSIVTKPSQDTAIQS
jgi:peptidoglycan/LPS O-acetylase OafA/YrhL